jgi:hypothetical protein
MDNSAGLLAGGKLMMKDSVSPALETLSRALDDERVSLGRRAARLRAAAPQLRVLGGSRGAAAGAIRRRIVRASSQCR